ncbi:MAG TPA: tetratricopeptide repeat protein, partial [Bacteroidia bacterium]|nr:tetratricopeptide repeat protein [Bacteroidia bacterium]
MKQFKILFFLLSVSLTQAQETNLDSLLHVWTNPALPDTIRMSALYDYTWDGYINTEPDSATYFGNLLNEMAKKNKSLKHQAKGIKTIGYANYIKGNLTIALDYYQQSMQLFEKAGLKLGAVNMQFGIANIYKMQGNVTKAISYYTNSLKKYEILGDKLGQGNCFSGIAALYQLENNLPKALEAAQKSINIFEEMNNKNGLALQESNIGSIYFLMQQFTKAEEKFNLGLKLYKELGRKDGEAVVLGYLGNLYDHLKQHQKAFECQQQCYQIYKQIGDAAGMAGSLNNLAYYYLDLNDLNKAIDYAKKALEIGNKNGIATNQRDAAETLYEAYEKSGKLKEAMSMYKLFISMRDTILNENNKQEILKQELEYNYEKEKTLNEKEHEKEIAISHEKESKQKVISISIAIGLIFVLLFALFIVNRLRVTNKQKKEIEFQKQLAEYQKEIVDEKQKEIIDSINYAKRIQTALIAGHELLRNNLPEHFVFFKPKDIVAGDFYWASVCPEGFLYITADCTGHGVPGAFMSLLNISKLSEAINQKHIYRPDLILNDVRTGIIDALNPKGSIEESKDGMDAVLCMIDLKNKRLQYAAANNAFYIIRNKKIMVCKADKMPVGKAQEDIVAFTHNKIDLQEGDVIYTFTD